MEIIKYPIYSEQGNKVFLCFLPFMVRGVACLNRDTQVCVLVLYPGLLK